MKKIILPIVLCVVAVAVSLYVLYSPNDGDLGRGAKREVDNQPAVSTANTDGKTAASAVGVPQAVEVERVVAGGVDEGLSSAPVREAQALVDAQRKTALLTTGQKAGARVEVGGKVADALVANEFGEFPKVYIRPSERVSVRVWFPDAAEGSRVVAQVEDGGQFAGGQRVAVLNLDAKREVSFDFTAGEEAGIYRIALRRGPDWKYVQLWAQQEP